MTKTFTLSAAAAATLAAGLMVLLTGASEQVSASAPMHAGKGDRMDIRVIDAKCSEQAWPNFDASCLKDRRKPMSQARQVRVVTTDRTSR